MDEPPEFLDATGQPFQRMPDEVRPGVGAVILDDEGNVLLEKRADNGFWGLPGGALSPGESIEEAAVREVLEETGLSVAVTRLVGIYSDPKRYSIMVYPGGQSVQYVTTVFECARRSGELRISNESSDLRYFNTQSLPENTLPAHRVRVEDAVAQRASPIIR